MTCLDPPRPCQAAVIGANGGIGSALAAELVRRSFAVHRFARASKGATALDLNDEGSIAAAVDTLDPMPLRIVIVATGLLHDAEHQPEKSMRALSASALARSFAVNAIGPALVAKHFIPHMPRKGRCLFAALSAKVGSIGDNRLGGWYGYRASKAALNQILHTTAIEAKRTHPELVVAALHPGTVSTALSAPFRSGVAAERLLSPAYAAERLLDVLLSLRPGQSGGFFSWDGLELPW